MLANAQSVSDWAAAQIANQVFGSTIAGNGGFVSNSTNDGRIAADPHCDPLLRRLLIVRRELAAALSAAILKQGLDAFVAATSHAKVGRVNSAGIVQPVLRFIPFTWSALDHLDRQAWLGGLPSHSVRLLCS